MVPVLFPVLMSLLWRECVSTPPTGAPVSCYVVNLEYVNCSWNQMTPSVSYSFSSKFGSSGDYETCPRYFLGDGGARVGCRVSYKETERFYPLFTSLHGPGVNIQQSHNVNTPEKIKMNPPINVSLGWENDDLVLTWVIRSGANNRDCLQSRVKYGLNDKWQNPVEPRTGSNRFPVSYASKTSRHEFQVQVRLGSGCGLSDWSEWSPLVVWENRTKSETSVVVAPPIVSKLSLTLYVLLAGVCLLLLTCLLVHSERLRVTLIPVVPTPGKNLTELIDTYNGNVEKWLCISKELQDGFKPSFTEHPYTAREYRLVTQSSVESDSGVSLLDSPSLSDSSSSCSSCSSSTSQTSDGSC